MDQLANIKKSVSASFSCMSMQFKLNKLADTKRSYEVNNIKTTVYMSEKNNKTILTLQDILTTTINLSICITSNMHIHIQIQIIPLYFTIQTLQQKR